MKTKICELCKQSYVGEVHRGVCPTIIRRYGYYENGVLKIDNTGLDWFKKIIEIHASTQN